MTDRNELTGSVVACESLDVREELNVGGSLTVGGIPITPSSYPDITNDPGVSVDIINQARLNVEHGIDSGTAFRVATPNGTHLIQSQSFPGRSFISTPEIGADFFGARTGPQAFNVGAGGTFNDIALVRSLVTMNPPIGGSSISGIDANTTGSNPVMSPFALLFVMNVGSGVLTLLNENAGSIAANRFTLPLAGSVTINPQGGVVIGRNASSRWQVIARMT